MKVAVTGGAGFIGTALIKELSDQFPDVDLVAMDLRWPDGKPDGANCFRGSVLDVDDNSRLLRGADAAIHLAAMLGVERTEEQRLRCLNVNIEGTRCVLDGCIKEDVDRVIFASSSEVYGGIASLERSQIPEDSPLNPKSVYAVSKLAGEEYVKAYAKKYGINYTIVRPFNVYGPDQITEFVIPKFVERARRERPLEIYGSGEQVRAFCHVRDAARAIVTTLGEPQTENSTLNIGNDREPISIRELAETVAQLAEKDVKARFVSHDESDRDESREIQYRVPDLTRAREMLGYEPRVSLAEGISDLLNSGEIGRQ